jgi:Dynamin central region
MSVQVLLNHIRDKLPDMKARLNTLMGQTQQELNAFGDTTSLGDHHQVLLSPVSIDFFANPEDISRVP